MSVYCFLKSVMISRSHNFLEKKKKKKAMQVREKKKYMCSLISRSLDFQNIYNNVIKQCYSKTKNYSECNPKSYHGFQVGL